MQIGLGTSITGTRGGVGISVNIGSGFAITGGTLTATVSGLVGGEAVTYQWTDDGGNISGATASTYAATIGTDSVADASRMRCVATVDGTPYTSNSRVLAYAAGTAPAIADGQALTVGGSANIDASASGANLTFTYVLSGGPSGTSINASTGAITGTLTTLQGGTATVTATDQYGRVLSDTFTYTVSAAAALALSTNVAVNGHSIVAASMGLERAIRIAAGTTPSKYHDMGGPFSTTTYRWDNRNSTTEPNNLSRGGQTTPQAVGEGGYGAFISIVSMAATIGSVASEGADLVNLYDLYYASNSGGQAYLLTWPNGNLDYPSDFGTLTPANWRAQFATDQGVWDDHLTYANANKAAAGADVLMIRGCEMMGLIYDQIDAGNGYSGASILDFMRDNVHPSEAGEWALGALHAYTMYGLDPVNAPLSLSTAGHDFTTITASVTAAQRTFLAPLIRQVVDNAGYDLTISPANTVPVISGVPTIAGTETEGETLTATAASVTGNPTPTRTWQWERGGTPISGATSATYTLVSADAGQTLTVVQTETNSEGADTAESSATGTIVALAAPVITGVPTIAGTETEGETLTATAASVSGNPTPTRTWQWERTGVAISGATSATYTLVTADVGETITVVQTETNSEGSDTAESTATGAIAAAAGGVDDPTTIMGANSLAWLDPQDAATMFNTVTGTGAIASDGDLVGRIVDQEGSVNFDAAANNATRPIYRTANGGYLEGVEASDTLIEGTVSRSGAFYVAVRMRLRSLASSTTEKFAVLYDATNSPWWNGPQTPFIVSGFFTPPVVTQEGSGPAPSLSLNTWATVEILYDTDSRIIGINGTDTAENTDTFAPPATGILALFSAPGEGGADLDIGRIAVASALPTSQQRIDMRAWLEA